MEEFILKFLNFKKKMKRKVYNKENKHYPFKVSVVIPVYNTEEYIQETLDSIYNQSMDFKDIQIILVNDGSTDGTHDILQRNADLYPENIKYINKKNEGVSIARNTGLESAEGKYINFIDSDDKWGLETFESAYNFLEEHTETDIVSSRLRFFDSVVGEHPLNYKFEKEKDVLVDLLKDYDNIQMHASSSFFRKSAIGKIKFDSNLKYAEDAKFVYDVLKKKYKLGKLSYINGCYFYRKRADESSAIDTAHYKDTFYVPTLENYHQYLIDDSRNSLGYVPKYIQAVLLYDLQYRFKYSDVTLNKLTEEQLKQYTDKILNLLKVIEDDVLFTPSLKVMNVIYQNAILHNRYKNGKLEIRVEDNRHNIYFNNIFLKSIENMYLKNESMYLKKGILKLSFSLPMVTDEIKVEPIIQIGSHKIIKADKATVLSEHYFLGEKVSHTSFYRFELPVKKFSPEFTLAYLVNDKEIVEIENVGKTLKTNFSNTKVPFKHFGNHTIRLFENKKFVITKIKKVLTIKNIIGLLLKNKTRKSGIYKIIGLKAKSKNKKRIWLFTDRLNQAEDNAEAFFDFIYKQKKEITPYYLIEKNNADYKRLKKSYGRSVVPFNSKKHHLLTFQAEKMITSHTEPYLFNPFGVVNGRYVRELIDFDFVFLQHGVTQNNVSKLLHKYNKPIDYFITSAQREAVDIIDKYGFLNKEVKITGLARFDLLKNKDIKKYIITFMPTWRPQLLLGTDEQFLESEFYKRTYSFLSDNKIKEWVQKSNVEIQFHLHPRMSERFIQYYKGLKHIKITDYTNYKEVISSSALLITDVSSVAFDVAYLNKPVVYYQFDLDDIYKYAIYSPGYFKYESDGFGPVARNEQDLIKVVESIRQNQFKLDSKYYERIKRFFAYTDKNNRKRIYEEIK